LEPQTQIAHEYLETVKQSAIDAAARIKQLQRFAGKSKNSGVYSVVKINSIIDDAITQTRNLWKDEAHKTGLEIMIKNIAKGDITVLGNDSELRSVLYILLKNSVQAMPQGGTITVDARREGNEVYLTVADTGIGMNEETKMKIFQPFFTTKGFELGKGLGMSSVYAIINEHKGKVYVKKSNPGEGTEMEIKLPYGELLPDVDKKSMRHYKGSARVLWVDDELGLRKIGKMMLESLGHTADIAGSGLEAIDLLAKGQYDLMITDFGMAGMSGLQLTERIKGLYPNMKIAVITGWGEESINDDHRKKYGIGYIIGKPIDITRLENLVGEVVQMKQI
jgi:CheY-like chemotaxis protein